MLVILSAAKDLLLVGNRNRRLHQFAPQASSVAGPVLIAERQQSLPLQSHHRCRMSSLQPM
jgi:hypothetical protein